jgi:putative transcriptional regulator
MRNKTERSLAYNRIKAGLENAIAHAQGRKTLTVRQVELPDPPEPMTPAQITSLRAKKLGVSQQVFARLLNASPQTVHAWEQGRAKPTGPTLRFLRIIEKHPDVITTTS